MWATKECITALSISGMLTAFDSVKIQHILNWHMYSQINMKKGSFLRLKVRIAIKGKNVPHFFLKTLLGFHWSI